MRDGIFVTGGSGFVGARLLAALAEQGRRVVALTRSETMRAPAPGVTLVRGDLLEPDTYRAALSSCDVVIHMAAATGRASADEHARVNARGTAVLIDACRAAGVPKLLFVSSIATTFSDKRGYHYALAKSVAELAVSISGLRFAILRPTMILGPGAPLLAPLSKLALLPLIVMPGNGRVKTQPIHVDDVVASILTVLDRDMFGKEMFEVGGPDVLTMEDLLQEIRRAHTGRSGRALHIPLALLRMPLRAAEAAGLGRVLPISAGQLTSFKCDSVASPNRLRDAAPPRRGLAEMAAAGTGDGTRVATRDAATAARPSDAECRTFTRYLLRCDPDAYVQARYVAAFEALPVLGAGSRFDGALLAFARLSPFCTNIADAYASLFARDAALRKRLVLLLAILETRPPFHQTIDRAIGGSTVIVFGKLGLSAIGSVLSLIAGTLIFVPTRVVLALAGKRAS